MTREQGRHENNVIYVTVKEEIPRELPRLYCCFQAALFLQILAGTHFAKEAGGSKCSHDERELIWRHVASESTARL